MQEKKIDRNNLEWILEQSYLVLFVVYISYFFLSTTTFEIEWPNDFLEYMRILMSVVIFARVAYSEKYEKKELLLLIIVTLTFIIFWKRNGMYEILNLLILIIGSKGIPFKKLARIYLTVTGLLLLYTFVCSLTGRVENLVYYQEGRRARNSFGIVYPTDFSAHIFYGVLVYCYLRREKIKYLEIGIIACLGVFVYIFCDARLNTVCLFLTAGIFSYHKMRYTIALKRQKKYEMSTIFSYMLALSTCLLAIFSIWSAMFYSSDNKMLTFIDSLLNARLKLGKKGIDLYGFTFSGQSIPMQGNGGTTKKLLHYFFIDNSYLSIVLQYGMAFFCVVLLIFLIISFRARKEKDWVLLWIIAIISIQCVIEHHMLEIAFNPFIWALFAETGTEKYDKENIFTRRINKLCSRKLKKYY